MTPREVSARLAQAVDRVCLELLPNGKRDGHEWRVGSVHGEPGKSLGVHLSGEKAGIWAEFGDSNGSHQSGDLLDLWCAVRNVSLPEALDQAKAMLGIHDHPLPPQKVFSRPSRPPCRKAQGGVAEYLSARGIPTEVLEVYKVAEQGNRIVFPFIRDGELLMVKTREAVDGAKPMPTEKNCEKTLFGWQAMPENARSCLIVEGEIDALSCYAMGQPAMSVPFGGGDGNKQDWIENDYPYLDRFDEIFLMMDNDEQGQKATTEIVKRLGPERCRLVTLPKGIKDANELLLKGYGPDALWGLMAKAKTIDPAELRPASDYDDAIDAIFDGTVEHSGFALPWEVTHDDFTMRYGETVVLGGVNGHGKSIAASQITAAAIADGVKSCVYSGEFKPERWLAKLTIQAGMVRDPTHEFRAEIRKWYRDYLWAFDVAGAAKAERLLEVFAYAAKRYGVRFFVIDNLSKLTLAGGDELQSQAAFMNRLSDFARDYDACVMLVVHMRKRMDENSPARKMDFKGSGAITDLADSVLAWHRNKAKEEAIRKVPPGEEIDQDLLKKPDAICYVEKQRNGDAEPHWGLYFDPATYTFRGQRSRPERQLVRLRA